VYDPIRYAQKTVVFRYPQRDDAFDSPSGSLEPDQMLGPANPAMDISIALGQGRIQ